MPNRHRVDVRYPGAVRITALQWVPPSPFAIGLPPLPIKTRQGSRLRFRTFARMPPGSPFPADTPAHIILHIHRAPSLLPGAPWLPAYPSIIVKHLRVYRNRTIVYGPTPARPRPPMSPSHPRPQRTQTVAAPWPPPPQRRVPVARAAYSGFGADDPSSEVVIDTANGVALDGGPLDGTVDGAPSSAGEMDIKINGPDGSGTVFDDGSGTVFDTAEIIEDAQIALNGNGNGNGAPVPAHEGIVGSYIGDIKTHPVILGGAFAVGWLLAKR